MDFYTYHYLQVHQQAFTLVGYGITIAASLLVLYYSWRYFRHRFVTKSFPLSWPWLKITTLNLAR